MQHITPSDDHTIPDESTDPDTKQVVYRLKNSKLPPKLQQIHSSPEQLYIKANNKDVFKDIMQRRRVAIVGSRAMTEYGRYVTDKFARELAAHGVVIISGLALGIDSVAHRAALDVKGTTMAVLPSSVIQIHPHTHHRLAEEIVYSGGALVSEYAPNTITFKPNFVARNRIVSALADAVLITEAAVDSGTMHTHGFATDQNTTVLAVPGNIDSPTSEGTNNLLKSSAILVTETADILFALGIEPSIADEAGKTRAKGANREEQLVLDLLERGIYSGSELLEKSGLNIENFNHHLTMLEITAKIRPLGADNWALR